MKKPAVILPIVAILFLLLPRAGFSAPPAAPGHLQAVPVYVDNDMRLTWTDRSVNETGFKIERKLTAGGTFTEIATVAAGTEQYTDTTASNDTEYTYRIRAWNADGDSGNSNASSNNIAVVWPLQNGSHEMTNGWQDGTVNNLWGFHEGIDIPG